MSEELARRRRLEQQHHHQLVALQIHAGATVALIAFLFMINVLSDSGNWWFLWPTMPLVLAFVIHFIVQMSVIKGPVAVPRVACDRGRRRSDRAARRFGGSDITETTRSTATDVPGLLENAGEQIDGIRAIARRLTSPRARQEALAFAAASDDILSALTDHPDELPLVRDFVDRFLSPAHRMIADYERLSVRNVPSARSSLARVVQDDLPRLTAKARDVHDRLHRGTLIDLDVAREMMALDLPDETGEPPDRGEP